MISAMQSAISGLNAATVRLNDVAVNIAQDTAQTASTASAAVPTGSPSLPVPGSAMGGLVSVFSDSTSLISTLVDLKEAEFLYTASAKVLVTVDNLQERLIDITS